MHHLYPSAKGDPLCPLGFHPQVRWPTRCKRCFRDYKEHGGRLKDQDSSLRKDETTVSSPSLSSWSSPSSRFRDDSRSSSNDSGVGARSWTSGSSSNLSSSSSSSTSSNPPTTEDTSRFSSGGSLSSSRFGGNRPASSWTSTPDLGKLTEDTQADITTVSLTLPRRRPVPVDTGQEIVETHTIPRRKVVERSPPRDRVTTQAPATTSSTVVTRRIRDNGRDATKETNKEESATTRQRRVQSLKDIKATEPPANPEVDFMIQLKKSSKSKQSLKEPVSSNSSSKKTSTLSSLMLPSSTGSSSSSGTSSEESYEDDSDDDGTSIAGTETTETTLIDRNENELQEQIDSLKQELEGMRTRCERVEREKSDILLRRIAAMDTAPSKTAASEVLKLQQRVNDLQAQSEDLKDEKKCLTLKVKELEEELEQRPDSAITKRTIDELRSKLLAAETLCEELMDENEDMKKELRDLEEEIEEMQDNFREEQADEYTSLRKELEQTGKNCRILSFKLRKAERKIEQLEAEKADTERRVGGGTGGDRIKHLEQELGVANETAKRLTKELDEAMEKIKAKDDKDDGKSAKKKPPMLGVIGKTSSGEKISRESMTRGGSQEDPQQLLRDLQDSMEREADLREQLKYAEEEAQTFRKKASRVEDDNESLVLQLKKMATKARSRRHSPSPARLTPEPTVEKDEGISDEEDPAELRLLLELNEQEAAVLRRKVEEMEKESEVVKRKNKDLQEKLNAKTSRKGPLHSMSSSSLDSGKSTPLQDKKIKILEEELSEIKKKLVEKERDCERLDSELTLTQKRYSKGSLQKTKSLDLISDQQTVDMKRQLQIIEQEASILRSRTQTLEAENDKVTAENKRLQMLRGTKRMSPMKEMGSADNSKELLEKINVLETQLTDANNKVNELKGNLEEQEKEAKQLSELKSKPTSIKDSVESSKLKKELKTKTDELEKIKTQTAKLEGENVKLNETLNRLKEEAMTNIATFYKARTPKKPTDFTTKVQMKKMVDELENEIGEVLVLLRKAETEKVKAGTEIKTEKSSETEKHLTEEMEKAIKELETTKQKVDDLTKELKEEHDKFEKEKKKALKDKKLNEEGKKKAEEIQKKMEDERKKWESELQKVEEAKGHILEEKNVIREENDKIKYDKLKLELLIEKLTSEKAESKAKEEEMPIYLHKIESLKNDLEEERRQGTSYRKKMEALQKVEQEHAKLQKELAEKVKKITELDKKMKDADEKIKKNDITTSISKTKITSLEKQLNEEKEKTKRGGESSSSLTSERDTLKTRVSELEARATTLEADLASKINQIQTLESNIREERARETDASVKAGSAEKREIVKLREELDASIVQVRDLTAKLEKNDKSIKESEEKFKKTEADLNKANKDIQTKASELEMDLQAERKKMDRMKTNQEKETKNKETELASLKAKLRTVETSSGASTKKINEVRDECQAKIQKMEEALASERQEYEDLTTKYEILEEEHVVTKAQLVMDKEAIQKQLQSAKRELSTTENELRTLRETYNEKQDTWIKEKLDLQERLKELEEKASRNGEHATNRLKGILEERTSEIEQFKKESVMNSDQMDYLRKENDELKKKLEDFDKVVKIHRNMTADTSAIDKELQETKNKLFQGEKSHKAEVGQLKLRYDSRVALISEEIQSLQNQVGRFKRERDTFRHMLEGAQKTIADLKESPGKASRDGRTSASSYDESEETRTKLASLDQQISCMEDELSEARLEASKLKTELVSERSAWEVKISEMQSKINELEEDRIVSSGRTKIPGLRTRMELAWHKEREEQHRLLQETSTLARDLRQTLFEVERERDKERLEAKRRHDQLKKTTEEDQDENRKKVTELQCDLLELRDAHAKLRTTNEKLRREKERNEKEREEWRQLMAGKKRAEADEERKVNTMLEQIEELMRLAPDLFPQKEQTSANLATPTPPRRLKGPKSRESSPSLERKEFRKESSVDRQMQLQSTVQRLGEATEELRKYQRLNEEEKDKDRARRSLGMRRAASTESDNPPEQSLRSKALNGKGVQKKGSLYRKSLSLEQTSASAQQDQSIWKNEDETDGSLTSLQSAGSEVMDSRYFSRPRREASLDSRLSGGSTQSDVLPSSDKKKKKGILGKLKKLTKSRSIDDTNTASDFPMSSVGQGSGSDISIAAEEKGSKKDLRERLTGIFRKGGSRSNSVERNKKEESPALPDRSVSSLQRPLVSSAASTLQRPSPARSDVSQTSTSSRPLVQKKSNAPVSSASSTLTRRAK